MGWEIPSGRRRGLPRYDCVFIASEIGGPFLGICEALMHPPHDVGGQPDVPVYYEEKEEEEWELNTYVTCEVLGWRGAWTAEERRRRADNDLGYTLYLGMPYYGRWIWSAAKMLVDKKHISLNELLEKIAEVRSRHGSK
jgi:hypothetical protein